MNFDFLATEFLSNQVSDYLLASVTLIIGILSIKILRRIAFRNLKKLAAKTRNIYPTFRRNFLMLNQLICFISSQSFVKQGLQHIFGVVAISEAGTA